MTSKIINRCSSQLLIRLLAILIASPWHTGVFLRAHEGHKPLPTRGMEVDAESGKMLLTKSARETLDVQTAEVMPQPMREEIVAYGSLVSPWTSHALVSSPLAGRIVALHASPGDAVRAGQLLAELESPELELLQLELRTAQIDYQLSTRLVNSTREASGSGALPGKRFIEAQSKQQQDLAAIEIASAKWLGLRLPQETLDAILAQPQRAITQRVSLTSPIDGIITHADLSIGKVVDPKEHLFEVLDHSKVWLKINLLEKDLTRVEPGQQVDLVLTAYEGETFNGQIDVVDSFLDPQTHQGTAWATFSNSSSTAPRLLPGMSGQVRIREHAAGDVLTVPMAAVIRDGAERFVLVEEEQTEQASTFQKQPLVLGKRAGAFIEVLGGDVFPGDRVVTRGSHELGSFFAKGVLTVSEETAKDIGLKLEELSPQQIARTFSIEGVVDIPPMHRSVASAQLGGKLERILVDRGERVRQGQPLAEIVSQEFQDLQLELLQADVDMRLRQTLVSGLRVAGASVPERQLWEAESQRNQARSRHDAAAERLRSAGLTQTQIEQIERLKALIPTLPVRAPIDGTLVGFDKFLGHIVRPDEPLFEIHDVSHAWVQAFLAERDVSRVKIGQKVRLRFVVAAGEVIEGTVVRSGQSLGNADRTASVWIEMQGMPSFEVRQNMLAHVTVEEGSAVTALALPRNAVIREATRAYVFVRKDDKTFERRLIEPAASNDLVVAVKAGLTAGESVVTHGAEALQSGYAALK